MTINFSESDMNFGPFKKEYFLHLEKIQVYEKIQSSTKMAEFALICPKDKKVQIWIVEAKKSSPKPLSEDKFSNFISEIKEKLLNGFSLTFAMRVGRHNCDNLPIEFKNFDPSTSDFRFILILKGHREDWLPPLRDALKNTLTAHLKTWAINPNNVLVLNENLARAYLLIK
jgi:hypothetical protein